MAKVALCCELGNGSGHLSLLADFIKPLKQQGHEICLIVQNIQTANRIPAFKGLNIYQAPALGVSLKKYQAVNFSSLLLNCGYNDSQSLAVIVKAWKLLFDHIGVDFVIAEHSPTPVLTAKLLGLNCAVTGSGFTVPPLEEVMPNFRIWEQIDESVLTQSDALLVSYLNETFSLLNNEITLHDSSFQFARDLYSHAHQWIISYPELDHYSQRDQQKQIYLSREPSNLFKGSEPVWPLADGEKVFIYLNQLSPHMERIFKQLGSSNYNVLAIVPNANEQLINKLSTPNLTVQRKLVDVEQVAKQCQLVITHAGYATTQDFFLHGIPSLFVPLHVETTMLSVRLGLQQLGFAGNPSNPAIDILPMLTTVKKVQAIWDQSKAFAKKYAEQPHADFHQISDVIREHI